ncbi:MAG: sugar ABC transporter ATP-binding protein [Chitinophagaceae bacterium]|nr:sugar ABC transporter ATP-binding protein [Chitinophagaceae bacterium]
MDFLLQAENISKSFPGVRALNNVQLQVKKGTVHALMGENGAGKSTLMKILVGMYRPDEGSIYFKGQSVHFKSVHDAIQSGITMIHQELLPFPDLSVAENIFMGNEPRGIFPGWINLSKRNRDAKELLERLGLKIAVNQRMGGLSIAETQMVEIARALSNKAELIIMDEPTSALSDKETSILFDIIRELKREGISIIYISHKMDEILHIADTITVMRDGEWIGTYPATEVSQDKLISFIVGRELNTIFERRNHKLGDELFSVSNLDGAKFKGISFSVRSGEVLGIAGLMGAGRTEVVNAIFGLEQITAGTIKVKGRPVKISAPNDAIGCGIGLITEDRKRTGLVLSATVKDNMSLASLKKISRGPFIKKRKEVEVARREVRRFAIKTPSVNQVINYLSGGNQQKVVMAKVLLNDPDIIMLDEPTRGIDIGAKAEIYKLINELAAMGKAIIVISSELPEVLGLSDRILVMREGRIQAELTANEATQEKIMQYAMNTTGYNYQ